MFAHIDLLPDPSGQVFNAEALFTQMIALLLDCASNSPRNRLRNELTRQAFPMEGINIDRIEGRGETPLAQQWTCLHFGDCLAMSYGVDPTQITAPEDLKQALKSR